MRKNVSGWKERWGTWSNVLGKSFRKKGKGLLSRSMNSNMQTPERNAIMQMQD